MAIETTGNPAPDWCCVDCLFWLANGELPDSWTDEQKQSYLARVERTTGDCEVTLGMFAEYHECQDEDGEIADDCECEQTTFSWSPCALCGSTLGGAREAITFHEASAQVGCGNCGC